MTGGLDIRHRSAIAQLLASMGFNSVRIPYSDELVIKNPIIASSLLKANPDLAGLPALDVLVATVDALTEAGLAVIINDHITQAGWCDGKNLCDAGWSNSHLGPLCRVRQTEQSWIENWETIMRRFVSNPLVVGADLRNEPRGLWGMTSWGAWASAAERCSERLLKLSPHWLMIVEGISSANDVSGARDRPVVISVPNKLVYSVHVFSWSGWGSMSPFSSRPYPSFALEMHRNWGYLLDENIAPVWVAEMGGPRGPGKGDQHYWRNLMMYMSLVDADFGYWAVNPRKPKDNEVEYWGLVLDDWQTIVEDYRLEGMRALMTPKEENITEVPSESESKESINSG